MPKARTKKKSPPVHPLIGTWITPGNFSAVEYLISAAAEGFTVSAVDRQDGEQADIFETAWDGETLTFAAHWNSTGRFARCRFRVLADDYVEFTYNYTDQEMLQRKP